MKLSRISLPLIVVAIAGVLVFVWRILSPSRFDPDAPSPKAAQLAPLSVQQSRFNLPISVPIGTVEAALEQAAPRNMSGSEDGPYGTTIHWGISRGRLSMSSGNDVLSISSGVNGYLRFTRDLPLVGEARATFDVGGRVSVSARPRLSTDWHLSPNLSTHADINEAEHEVFNLFPLSVRSRMRPKLQDKVSELRDEFESRITGDDFLERAAMEEWSNLCRCVRVASDPEFWLEIKPVAAHAAQVRINSDNLRFQLGLDVETRVVTEQTQPNCPFPKHLILEEPKPGNIEILLPAEISYEALETALTNEVVGETFGEDVAVTIEAVSLRPHGSSLLLETNVSAKVSGWLGAPSAVERSSSLVGCKRSCAIRQIPRSALSRPMRLKLRPELRVFA